jgi:hypothetical protein
MGSIISMAMTLFKLFTLKHFMSIIRQSVSNCLHSQVLLKLAVGLPPSCIAPLDFSLLHLESCVCVEIIGVRRVASICRNRVVHCTETPLCWSGITRRFRDDSSRYACIRLAYVLSYVIPDVAKFDVGLPASYRVARGMPMLFLAWFNLLCQRRVATHRTGLPVLYCIVPHPEAPLRLIRNFVLASSKRPKHAVRRTLGKW